MTALLVHDALDFAQLSVATLPPTSRMLRCGRCGDTAHQHGTHTRQTGCGQFTRPLLPAGYAYIDTLERGCVIVRRSSRDGRIERLLGRTEMPSRVGQRMLCVRLAHVEGGALTTTYLAPDTIVRLA